MSRADAIGIILHAAQKVDERDQRPTDHPSSCTRDVRDALRSLGVTAEELPS